MPSGEEYFGIKVSIGKITDPSSVRRTYEDIEAILGRNKVDYKTHEVRTDAGLFRSYTISTD